jgi:hypothetical protein
MQKNNILADQSFLDGEEKILWGVRDKVFSGKVEENRTNLMLRLK